MGNFYFCKEIIRGFPKRNLCLRMIVDATAGY